MMLNVWWCLMLMLFVKLFDMYQTFAMYLSTRCHLLRSLLQFACLNHNSFAKSWMLSHCTIADFASESYRCGFSLNQQYKGTMPNNLHHTNFAANKFVLEFWYTLYCKRLRFGCQPQQSVNDNCKTTTKHTRYSATNRQSIISSNLYKVHTQLLDDADSQQSQNLQCWLAWWKHQKFLKCLTATQFCLACASVLCEWQVAACQMVFATIVLLLHQCDAHICEHHCQTRQTHLASNL